MSLSATLDYTIEAGAYNNTVLVSNLSALNYPKIVADESPASPFNGTVYVLGLHLTDTMTCNPLVVARSFDAGSSFEAPFEVDLCLDGNTIDPAVAPNGTVYFAASGPVVYGSNDSGVTWRELGAAASDPGRVSLTVDPITSALYVVWEWYGDGPAYPVRFAASHDGGVTWTVPVDVVPAGTGGYSPQVTAYNDTVVISLGWNPDPAEWNSTAVVEAVVSHDGGATFAPAIPLSGSTWCMRFASPAVTASPHGVFAISWYADPDYVGSGCWDNWGGTTKTWVSVSTDDAQTFSSPRDAGGPPGWPTWGLGDSAAFDSASRLYVAWLAMGGPGAATNTVYVANSTDFGQSFESASFSTILELSGGNSTGQLGLTPGPAGKVYMVWPVYIAGSTPVNDTAGVYVRTVTGEVRGNVSLTPSVAPAQVDVAIRPSGTSEDMERVPWTGVPVTVQDLPPSQYEVRVYSGDLSSLAGTLPIRTWGLTTFTVHVSLSGGGISPPVARPPSPPPHHARGPGPEAPFVLTRSQPLPWLPAGLVAGGCVLATAAVLASVLHTRLLREEALQRKVRLLMYEYIQGHPGASFSDVRGALGLQNGVASYHLAVLEKLGLVHSESRRRHRWYYTNGDVSLWRELPLSPLQQALVREIESSPGIGVRELSRRVDRRASSVGYNVRALTREGVLKTERVGRRVLCFPAQGVAAPEAKGVGGS